jgi:hypothetical protein
MKIGVAAQEDGVVAGLRIDEARQGRIGKAKIRKRRIREIEKRQAHPTMLSAFGRPGVFEMIGGRLHYVPLFGSALQ